MLKKVFFLCLISLNLCAQKNLAYEWVQFYEKDSLLKNVSTHSNVDIFENGRQIIFSTREKEVYSFLIPESEKYPVNRFFLSAVDVPANAQYYSSNFEGFLDYWFQIRVSEDYVYLEIRGLKNDRKIILQRGI